MLLKRRSHLGARAVQEHSLIGLGQVQGVARLLGAPPQQVAHGDHLALARREVTDRPQHHVASLGGLELALGFLPRGGRARPPSRPLAPPALEAIGVDRWATALLVAAAKERKGQDASLAGPPGAR